MERAFPVQEAQSQADTLNVEMDAADEARVQHVISKQYGMRWALLCVLRWPPVHLLWHAVFCDWCRCVGWYHSHPHAATHPSTADILEQIAQQKRHRIAGTGEEPFIGAIVGPYPAHSQSLQCDIAYYHVEYPRDREMPPGVDPIAEGCLPMEVQVSP